SDLMRTYKKPIYPIFTSVINAKDEIQKFVDKGNVVFFDEVTFGDAFGKVMNTAGAPEIISDPYEVDVKKIREVIDNAEDGYISPTEVGKLLDAAGIVRAGEAVVTNADDAACQAAKLGFPVVMKVVGPIHKSDVGGVVLNVKNDAEVKCQFDRMIKIKDTTAILIQPMLSGVELYAGAKFEPKFGHLVLFGLGGIFIEVLKDVQSGLAPLAKEEVEAMVKKLKGYKMLQGVRGQEGVDIDKFEEAVVRLSLLVEHAPEIVEMDLNPLLGNSKGVVDVDARIKIDKGIK
ncbi:MAG: acetate--CoA ligase family protein, partial [Bacteroidales bacterium]|nr:acetate--CoA ligase family protein [Bacteroidales bacterium]